MKKDILSLILGCCYMGIVFVSCGNDDAIEKNDSDQVQIDVVCPEKVMSAEHKLRCILEVWTIGENSKLISHKEIVAESENVKLLFDITLSSDTYKCMMWADYIDADGTTDADGSSLIRYTDKFYDTSDLSCVTVKNVNSLINNEASNAFFYSGEIQKDGEALQMNLELVPALTKISIQENNLDEFSYLRKVQASYESFLKFDVATGTVIEEKQEVTYNEPNFNPSTIVDGTLFSMYMFSDDKERRLGKLEMNLEKLISSSSTKEQQVSVPDIIPLLRGQHIKVSGSMLEVTERENEFDILFDIDVEDWKSSNVDITKINEE